jgi:hypothetical protein
MKIASQVHINRRHNVKYIVRILVCFLSISICFLDNSYGQTDSTFDKVTKFPSRIFAKINSKSSNIDRELTKQTEKYLRKLEKKEQQIQNKLYKIDSNAAKNLFAGAQEKYKALHRKLTSDSSISEMPLTGEYLPYADSLKASLSFAQANPDLINASPKVQHQISTSYYEVSKLQNQFVNADQVRAFVQQRKQMIKDQLMQYVQNSQLKKYFDDYNKDVYYVSAQIKEYKEALNDPDKMLQKALVILNKIPAFTKFIKENGQLAGLFGISDNYGTIEGVEGLQTRDQIQQLLQGTAATGGAGGMSALQSNLESAHQQLDQFKEKLSSLGSGSGNIEMPNFKPNDQKTKTFLKRLELGINLQTTRANGYFPSTTDFGFSVGYKASNKITFGLGGSYNVGWGTSIQHIHFSSQGLSIRSFIDMQIKKNLFITSGFEESFTTPFTSVTQLETTSLWKKSGLIGLSKMVSLPGKIIKKTKVSLLWNFLSNEQPKTQAILFRVGYNF